MAVPSPNAQYMEYMIEGKKKKSVAKLVVSALIVLAVLTGCAFGAYNFGKSSGCAVGYDEGYEKGYTAGHEDGYKKGKKADYNNGYEASYNDGYDAGYDDGLAGVERGKKNQFDLTDDEIDAATKAARDKTEENYAEYADIIADGYKAN